MYSLDEIGKSKKEIIEYTANALEESGHSELIWNMQRRAEYSADYDTLLLYCQKYLDLANGLVE